MINTNVFRKYDIRGTINKDFVPEDFYRLTQIIIKYLKDKSPTLNQIAVAMDGRTHSTEIKNHVLKAVVESGIDIIYLGLCPTPLINFAMHTKNINAGIMITASHNPKEDNGLKIFLNKQPVWDIELSKIKDLYCSDVIINNSEVHGKIIEQFIINDYVNWIHNNFPQLIGFDIKTIIDCSNGAGGAVLPLLKEKMQWSNTKLIFEEIDGNFPHHKPDPTIEENLKDLQQQLMHDQSYEFGLALDGDADRLAVMTKHGKLVAGDHLLSLFSKYLQNENHDANNKKQNSVVFDIKCSSGLTEILESNNLKPIMSPTGYAYIKELMHKENALLGGELSGHYIFADKYFGYDDGIYGILRVFEIMKFSKQTLDILLESYPKKISSPEFRIICSESEKNEIILNAKKFLTNINDCQILEIDGIRMQTKYGWGLLRTSNTQAMLSLRFESNTDENLIKIKEDFFNAIVPYFESNWLKQQMNL